MANQRSSVPLPRIPANATKMARHRIRSRWARAFLEDVLRDGPRSVDEVMGLLGGQAGVELRDAIRMAALDLCERGPCVPLGLLKLPEDGAGESV